jgi:hypothetical protein
MTGFLPDMSQQAKNDPWEIKHIDCTCALPYPRNAVQRAGSQAARKEFVSEHTLGGSGERLFHKY